MLEHKTKTQEKQSLSSLTKEIENTIEFEIEEVKYLISDLIFKIMEDRGISRAKLAGLMHRSRPFVTKLLSGNNNFEISTLVHVSRACGYKLNVRNLFVSRSDSSACEVSGPNPWGYINRGDHGHRDVLWVAYSRFPTNEQFQQHDNEPESEEVSVENDAPRSAVA